MSCALVILAQAQRCSGYAAGDSSGSVRHLPGSGGGSVSAGPPQAPAEPGSEELPQCHLRSPSALPSVLEVRQSLSCPKPVSATERLRVIACQNGQGLKSTLEESSAVTCQNGQQLQSALVPVKWMMDSCSCLDVDLSSGCQFDAECSLQRPAFHMKACVGPVCFRLTVADMRITGLSAMGSCAYISHQGACRSCKTCACLLSTSPATW